MNEKFTMPLTQVAGINMPTTLQMGDNNPESSTADTSSNSAQSSTAGSSSNTVTPNDLKDNLISPSNNDKVVYIAEKSGLSITDVFIGNVQNKLYRGVSLCIENGVRNKKGITFAHAVKAINAHYPEYSF